MSQNNDDCGGCWTSFVDWIQYQDILYDPTYMNFHFDSDQKNKSLCGGTISILIKLYLFFAIITLGAAFASREEPYVSTIEVPADDTGRVSFSEVSEPFFEIASGPDSFIDLDSARAYINV